MKKPHIETISYTFKNSMHAERFTALMHAACPSCRCLSSRTFFSFSEVFFTPSALRDFEQRWGFEIFTIYSDNGKKYLAIDEDKWAEVFKELQVNNYEEDNVQ